MPKTQDPNALQKNFNAVATTAPEVQRLRRVLDATSVEHPKASDIDELKKLLAEYPDLWKLAGEYFDYAANAIIRNSCKQALIRESAMHGIEVLKKEMGYEHAPALERLLIEHIVICRLQLLGTQTRHANNSNGVTITQADYWERRLTQTQVRFLRACETLARVRKLSQPGAMQVNIGAQQVNLAQGAPSTNGTALAPGPDVKK